MKNTKVLVLPLLFLLISCGFEPPEKIQLAYDNLPEEIDFNFHIRPILSDRCYRCHGPDESTRRAGLRLDSESEAFSKLSSGNFAFVSRKPDRSEVLRRILSDDPHTMMPPLESNLSLTDEEKAFIVKWVEQGAQWKEHWAFTAPEKLAVPEIENDDWNANNPIDNFVLNKLDEQGFEPSIKTNKGQLIRRVTMDLTGLPPSIYAIEEFLIDESDDAYEKVVDRLLKSEEHAERLALDWMDLSRYADSHGLHADGARLMWPWRDWVIEAFQKNMSYDTFVTWQLAGDLLPNANKQQKLATAFNRNHPMTAEGGAIDEEFRLNYVFDRTETLGTAFLGLTLGCAKCHDHKFDPISQQDYFQMTSFFNNVKELGMTGDDGNYGPMLALPESSTEKELENLHESIEGKERQIVYKKKELSEQKEFLKALPTKVDRKELIGHYPLNSISKKAKGFHADNTNKSSANSPPKVVEGKNGNAFEFTGEYDELYLNNVPNFEWIDSFSAAIWMNTSEKTVDKTQTLMGTAGEKNNFWRGWDFYLDEENRLNARLISSLPHNYIHVRSKTSIATDTWKHVAFTYSGTSKAEDLQLYIDGSKTSSEIVFNNLYKSIKTVKSGNHALTNRAVRVAKSYRSFTGENGIFKGKIDDIYVYSRALYPFEVAKIAGVSAPHSNENSAASYWVDRSTEINQLNKELKSLREDWLKVMMPVMEVMVMEEMENKRQAFFYERGNYDQPKHEVESNTPKLLPEFSADYPKNRLGLSQWLFAEENPLTARVTVNRYWQMLFGNGLVSTPQDFGVQGALPSHPKLLDWMAITFMENDWDLRSLLKTMVMSNTYCQTSKSSPEMREKDPNNIFLSRSSSYRLPAEMIRDNALMASGLLVQQLGGKSVKPYQPPNLWVEKSTFSHELLRYKESEGDSLYRRSMYTFVRRTQPHPAMTAFDAPSREVCIIKRENTNTPLQALILLNDIQFVEASKVLAERIQKEQSTNVSEQIAYAFRLVTSRVPKSAEIDLLVDLFESQLERFKSKPKETLAYLNVGNAPRDKSLDIYTTAALSIVANTILNHDEAYTKR